MALRFLQQTARCVCSKNMSFPEVGRNLNTKPLTNVVESDIIHEHGVERKINIDGQTINYLKLGNGPKTLFCLPGTLGSIWTDFKPQLEGLSKTKFTIIAWDAPGLGKSSPPGREYPLDFFQRDAECAAKLLKVLDIDKVSLLGWSDGGITSLIISAKYPELVDKLVVWGSKCHILRKELPVYEAMRNIDVWSKPMREPMEALYGKDNFQRILHSYLDGLVQIYKQRGGEICQSMLPDIVAPTLILYGAKDVLVPKEHCQTLLDSIKNSRLHTFKDGKHNVHIKYAAEFNKIVEEFIDTPATK